MTIPKRPLRHLGGLLAVLAALTAGCGGGGAGGPAGAALTKTSGNVTSVNGSSADVAGVSIDAPDAGVRATSGFDGSFDLGDLPAETVRLEVTAPGATTPEVHDVDLSGGGRATVRMTIDDDHVVDLHVEHCHDGGSEEEARAALSPLLPDLSGKVEIERDGDGDQKIGVEAEHLAPGTLVSFWVLDPGAGLEESLGTATADALGEAEVERETEHGAVLPLGATDVADLEGFGVEVRDATTGAVLLEGTVPALGSDMHCEDDEGHGGDDLEGRARLENAAGVAGEARVRLRHRADGHGEELEVQVERSGITGTVACWLEDPSNRGTLVFLGNLVPDDDGEDELVLDLETDDGDTLPFGVASVEDLVGLGIELRDGAGTVLYFGTTPTLNPF